MHWRKIKSAGISLLLAFAFLVSCERISVDPDTSRAGYDYYPLEMGSFRIYDVYRINYNFASENDTLQFEVKELISDQYRNQEGDSTFVLQRFSRREQEIYWKLDSIFHIRRTIYQAIELNNNRPIVKMVFPVDEGKKWNSNQLNALETDSFKMVEVHKPFLIQDSAYQKTLTVLLKNIQDTIVHQDVRKEVFALGVGTIYRLVKNLKYCATPDCVGQGIVNTGTFEEMKLKEYGKE